MLNPVLYQLEDLLNDIVPGYFYSENLVKCPPITDEQFFEVEKVLKTKTIKKQKYYFVKFLYYPNKFNMWIPETNFKPKKK